MVLLGFNTDFKYRGETYHVQTEDNGVQNPVVVTLLYFKGAILASKKTPYRELLDRPDFQKEVMDLMKSQHKLIMKELLSGTYDGNLGGAAPPPVAAAPAPEPAPASAVPPAALAAQAPPITAPAPPPTSAPAAATPQRVAAPATPSVAPPPAASTPGVSGRRGTPPPLRAAAPSSPLTLDQAIMRYLEEYAASRPGAGTILP